MVVLPMLIGIRIGGGSPGELGGKVILLFSVGAYHRGIDGNRHGCYRGFVEGKVSSATLVLLHITLTVEEGLALDARDSDRIFSEPVGYVVS